MRISDWSSDVCSSDLPGTPEIAGARSEGTTPGQRDFAQGICVFCDGGARPPREMMMAFIDVHREDLGIEPICRELAIAPSSYHEHAARDRKSTRLNSSH